MKVTKLLCVAALAALCLAPEPACGCLNSYESNHAARQRSANLLDELTKEETVEPWTARRDRLKRTLAQIGDYKMRNDYAVALLHTGEAKEAVALLEGVEAEKPGLYPTASNLGTAYELAGENEKALEWIRKGIERNPLAHNGSEWIHVRILEAKIALATDPNWLETHRILGGGLNEKEEGYVPLKGNRGEPLALAKVKEDLKYQLHERLQFVKPPDIIVGELLLNLATLVAEETTGPSGAARVLDLSANYLYEVAGLGVARLNKELETAQDIRHFDEKSQRGAPKRSYEGEYLQFILLLCAGGVAALGLIWVMRRSRRVA